MSGGLPAAALQPHPAAGSQPVQHAQVGLWWPAADPARLRAAAAAWRSLAGDVEAVSGSASAVARGVAGENQGQAVDAFEAYWGSRWVGGNGALPAVAEGARALADGLDRYAAAVDKARAQIEELIVAAATVAIIGVGLTVLTVGISDVAAGAVAGSLIAAAAAVGMELSTEVAAIIATGLVFAGMGALEGGLSDLAIQEERVGHFHDQTSINWAEVLQFSAVGAATAGATLGAGAVLETAVPMLGRIGVRLGRSKLGAREGDASLTETGDRAAGGLRRSPAVELSAEDIKRLEAEFRQVGGDTSKLRFNEGSRTAYVDRFGIITVRGDVFPLKDPNAVHPRSTMSTRAVLAHELGHMRFRGTSPAPGSWNDEFRASYWAAKNAMGLSVEERIQLIQDALLRAREAGQPIKNNHFILELLYGIRP